MPFAFAPSTPLLPTWTSPPAVCSFTPALTESTSNATAATSVTMRCRRDLKKEKHMRNLEFARAHRKRVVRRYNRRAVAEATANADNEYLSSIYGTMRFGVGAEEKEEAK